MATKILMFGWEFPPHNSGGLGVACKGLSMALASRTFEIIFVLPKRVDISESRLNLVFADIDYNIKIKAIDSLIYPYITSTEYSTHLSNGYSPIYGGNLMEEVIRYAVKASGIARHNDFDVIHAHDWLSFPAGIHAKKVSGKPLIVHVHATEFDRTGGKGVNQEVYDIEKKGMEEADAVIAVSNFTKDIIVRHYGINPEKINVVHNGVDEREFNHNLLPPENLMRIKEDGTKIVLFVGRITLQKGPDYFIRVAKKVLDHNPKVLFIISGSGDMEAQILNDAAYLGISDKVLFTGFLRGDELNQIFKLADIYILPSVSEPFGITPLEALMNKTPVLVSRQSGSSEVLSHALKADFWDIDDMAHKILAVLEYEPLSRCLAENGHSEVKGINWHRSADKCISVYNKVLDSFNNYKEKIA
ncbi:MAG: 4-alpha-glucanotransferase [Parcubacteria group bacterium CG10_big_fil_rev_8_21_14_0_10_38_31]|nr:MAG: 4-alpha-glucanotransferase [Parcubacteria group bacterium CG10_big_fil_rev_8_21_14_0_10_38_31]